MQLYSRWAQGFGATSVSALSLVFAGANMVPARAIYFFDMTILPDELRNASADGIHYAVCWKGEKVTER